MNPSQHIRLWSGKRLAVVLALCGVAWVVSVMLTMSVGTTGGLAWPGEEAIRAWRFERAMLASLVGAALAGAGVAFQAVLRNPLADPYLIGVASGAALGQFLWKLPVAASWGLGAGALALLGQQGTTLVFGLIAAAVALGVAGWSGRLNPSTLLLAGVMISTLVSSLLLVLHRLVRSMPGAGGIESVIVGELQSNLLPGQLVWGAIVVVLVLGELLRRSGKLNVSSLDEDESRAMGLRVQRERWIVMLLATLMTAVAVSLSGPVGFVGLICPHMGRMMVGSDHRRLLPVSVLLGAVLVSGADAAARYLSQPGMLGTMMPLGAVTALVGGPVFLFMLMRRG